MNKIEKEHRQSNERYLTVIIRGNREELRKIEIALKGWLTVDVLLTRYTKNRPFVVNGGDKR